jgi:hypothetical protein
MRTCSKERELDRYLQHLQLLIGLAQAGLTTQPICTNMAGVAGEDKGPNSWYPPLPPVMLTMIHLTVPSADASLGLASFPRFELILSSMVVLDVLPLPLPRCDLHYPCPTLVSTTQDTGPVALMFLDQ